MPCFVINKSILLPSADALRKVTIEEISGSRQKRNTPSPCVSSQDTSVIVLMNPCPSLPQCKGESLSSAKLIQIMFSRLTLLSTCCCMIPSMNVDLTPTQILAFRGSVSVQANPGDFLAQDISRLLFVRDRNRFHGNHDSSNLFLYNFHFTIGVKDVADKIKPLLAPFHGGGQVRGTQADVHRIPNTILVLCQA